MAGILKVDTIQNANADNIITQTNSTTLTIGASGDTVTLAAGATSSGFGATYNGAINWDTTAKTTGFTAVSGVGYFCNTTGGAFTVTLPSTPSAGAIVAITDYAGTAATNNITIGRNGSKIEGLTENAIISTNRDSITLVYIDSTQGWLPVSDNTGAALLPQFVAATGGCIATCGNYKIHSFTGPGTFTVTNAGNPLGSAVVDYLVLAGGGAGGTNLAGGGGAGGYRESVPSPAAWTASPLANPGGALPVSVIGYPITVGAGGAGASSFSGAPNAGNPSIFSTITSTGGGYGGTPSYEVGLPGGSGGGGSYAQAAGGTGNTPPVSPPQGNAGGFGLNGPNYAAAGGGGAGGAGTNGTAPGGGPGGNGVASSITGTPTTRAGGGGGAGSINDNNANGTGGSGGGGTGQRQSPVVAATNGGTNLGGGGGGRTNNSPAFPGTSGGSGIVIVRYKFQ